MNKHVSVQRQYEVAYEVNLADMEEAVMKTFGLEEFAFHVVEHESGDFLILPDHLTEEDCFREYLEIDEDEEFLGDEQDLEDAAHKILCTLMGINIRRTIIVEEGRKLVILG